MTLHPTHFALVPPCPEIRVKTGFTLIELMITVTIIGILATIAIPKFADMVRKAQEGALKGDLGTLRGAIAIYYSDNEGWYPSFMYSTGICGDGTALADVALLPTLTANGKYLASIPNPNIPDYHTALVIEYDMYGASVQTSDFSSFEGASTWRYFSSPCYPATWGQVYVDCFHTDAKGTAWSSY